MILSNNNDNFNLVNLISRISKIPSEYIVISNTSIRYNEILEITRKFLPHLQEDDSLKFYQLKRLDDKSNDALLFFTQVDPLDQPRIELFLVNKHAKIGHVKQFVDEIIKQFREIETQRNKQ